MLSCTLASTSVGFSFGLRFSLSLAEPFSVKEKHAIKTLRGDKLPSYAQFSFHFVFMIRYEIDLKGAFVKEAVSAPLFLFTSGVA